MDYYEKYMKYKKKYMNLKSNSRSMHGGVGPTERPANIKFRGLVGKVMAQQQVIKRLSLFKYEALATPETIRDPETLFGAGQPNNDDTNTIKEKLSEQPYKEMVDTGFFKFMQLKDILGLYRPVLKLGAGAFGETFKTSNNYALKWLALYKQEPDFDNLMSEALAGFKLRDCPDIAKIHQIFYDEEHNQMFFILDLINGKNLDKILDTVPNKTRKEQILTLWPSEKDLIEKVINPIVRGLRFMHNRGIAHRDLKNENIMYDIVKQRDFIIDFGLSCLESCNPPFSGTPAFWPPEYDDTNWEGLMTLYGDDYECIRPARDIEGAKDYDIYALGATIYLLFTGKYISDKDSDMNAITSMNPYVSTKVSEFALKCLANNCITRRKDWEMLTDNNGLKN